MFSLPKEEKFDEEKGRSPKDDDTAADENKEISSALDESFMSIFLSPRIKAASFSGRNPYCLSCMMQNVSKSYMSSVVMLAQNGLIHPIVMKNQIQ
jgi:hypothetical protein